MSTSDRIALRLDDWKFWVGVAYFGLAIALLGLYIVASRQSTETAKRVAMQRANAQSQVSQCASSVRNAPIVLGFAESHRAVVVNSILTTTAALQATPASDPLHNVRVASLARLEKALRNADHLTELVIATTPTKADCNRMADARGIPRPFQR